MMPVSVRIEDRSSVRTSPIASCSCRMRRSSLASTGGPQHALCLSTMREVKSAQLERLGRRIERLEDPICLRRMAFDVLADEREQLIRVETRLGPEDRHPD